jgi:undecaprenyl-diphosphatase
MLGMIDDFDFAVVHFLNQFAGKSLAFDAAISVLVDTPLAKGALFMAIVWGLWFKSRDDVARRHALIVSTFGAVVAVIVSRILQHVIPSHSRPLHTPDLGFKLLSGETPDTLNMWNSFPSDHAVLFFALSMGLWYQSRKLGYIAMLWTLLVICLPRLYLGYHWPSDVVGGAIFGLLLMMAIERMFRGARWPERLMQWEARHRVAFYGLAFVTTYEIATLFGDLRHIASDGVKFVKMVASAG